MTERSSGVILSIILVAFVRLTLHVIPLIFSMFCSTLVLCSFRQRMLSVSNRDVDEAWEE